MSNKNKPSVAKEEASEAGQVQEVVEQAAPAGKFHIRAAYGTMIHPYVPMDIRTDAITEVDEIDSWLQSQIDEKKILIV